MIQFFSLLTEKPAEGGSSSLILILLAYGAFFALMWFVLIRPQKKKEKAVSMMQSGIKPGDSVLTQGGLYGTVVDIINDNLIVEFGINKGVRVPVQRNAVASVTAPELTVVKEEVKDAKEKAKENKDKDVKDKDK